VSESFLNGKVTLHRGDCLEVLPLLEANSVDSVVTDPPYGIGFMGREWDSFKPGVAREEARKKRRIHTTHERGDLGLTACIQYDRSLSGNQRFQAWCLLWAKECLRVLKPGGHALVFSSPRTYHRMACAIEDAGFEIRDQIGYAFGSGFPKSHNVSRNLAEQACQCGVRSVWDSNVSEARTAQAAGGEVLHSCLPQQSTPAPGWEEFSDNEGGEQPRMEGWGDLPQASGELCEREICSMPHGPSANGKARRLCDGASPSDGEDGSASTNTDGMRASSRPSAAQQSPIELGTMARQPEPQISGAWPLCERCNKPIIPDGIGSALKPAWEPICLARKPLSESSIAANVLKHGTGGINVDGCRVGTSKDVPASVSRGKNGKALSGSVDGSLRTEDGTEGGHNPNIGRWPANLIHDGSEEVLAGFPDASPHGTPACNSTMGGSFGNGAPSLNKNQFTDSGSAARFFYTAKADADDRLGSKHPTVKPIDLIQYLARLITPSGGCVLDPFAGTGTLGEAAWREGFKAILIEREEEYQADIVKRMGLCLSGPEERRAASVKQLPPDDLPMFGGGL
jgi:DNA modification methylase